MSNSTGENDEKLAQKIIDGLKLEEKYRKVLCPSAAWPTKTTDKSRASEFPPLPRFFFEVPSWENARETKLTPNFLLSEFINVDLREAKILHEYPRYVPVAIFLLASALQLLRERIGTTINIAANGGYRSPFHECNNTDSPHSWGTAVNIYKIGDELLDTAETAQKYSNIIKKVLPTVYVRPFGHGIGESDDHLHLDLGYFSVTPTQFSGYK